MARSERLSDQFIAAVASTIHPQGRAFVEFKPNGRVVFGKKHGGLNVEREKAKSPTIGSLRLEGRQDIISKCEKSLNLAAESTGVLAVIVAFDGIVRNKSARQIAVGCLGGVAVWMGARVIGEICEQTIENINERIALLDKMATSTPQEPKPQN